MDSPVLALLRAYNDHDVPAAVALYRADGEHREIAQGNSRAGGDALRASLEHFLVAFPDAHWEAPRSATDGGLSIAPYVLTGTLSAPLGPFEPAGQALRIEGVLVASVATDGLLEWTADYWDSGTFFRQMKTAG